MPKLQFSMRWLLLAMTIAAVTVAYISLERSKYIYQDRALQELQRLTDCRVADEVEAGSPSVLGWFVSKDKFHRVLTARIGNVGEPIYPPGFLEQHLKEMPWLRAVDARWTDLDDRHVQEIVKAVPQVEHLLLFDVDVSDAGCRELSKLDSLLTLGIGEGVRSGPPPHLTPQCVIEVAKVRSLRKLIISLPDLTSKELSPLAGLTHLEVLDVSWSRVDDLAIPTLTQLRRLKRLDISETDVTAEGLHRLKQQMPGVEIVWGRMSS
ncbi:leucine-rich repeat domain-containing protein [Aeoliella mucimassa]|uniref:Leucine Rich repeats (2 copies) n=1 Tax=Aeoliella mucimassa TaxID=2527972 RepID=A0A518AJT2_9BACT|nr:hypothetical protein [Aeoliella mucimassa]QDU55007.1 hypothetical protein Pan181_11920 [Aeoliella mucimassa]